MYRRENRQNLERKINVDLYLRISDAVYWIQYVKKELTILNMQECNCVEFNGISFTILNNAKQLMFFGGD